MILNTSIGVVVGVIQKCEIKSYHLCGFRLSFGLVSCLGARRLFVTVFPSISSRLLDRWKKKKALQAIQSPRPVPFFLLVSLLDGYSFPNVLVQGIVAFKH